MDLNEFSRQLESMHARFMQLCPTDGLDRGDLRSMWEETSEALGVTMEELRVAEEELRQQTDELEESRQTIEAERQRYQDLFDFAPDGYLVTDLAGVIREANRAAGELLGIAARYLTGKPLASYIAMDDRAAFRGGLTRLLREGRRENWIVRVQPRRGGSFDAAITAAVVRDWDGAPSSLRWLFREIAGGIAVNAGGVSRANGRVTIGLAGQAGPSELEGERWARIRAEDEAEALRGLLHGIDLIVWEADAETGRYWFISPRVEQRLGYPASTWLEAPGFWAEIVHAEDRPMAEAHRTRCLRDGRAGEVEYRVVASDGRAIWFRESLSIEADAEGRPRVIRGCLWEIGRRKKVERQLYTDRTKLAEHLADVLHLHLLSGHLLAKLDLAPVLEEILAAVTSLQGAELGAILLLDRDRDELETVVSLGLPAAYLERFGRMPVGVEACGLAVERGGPVIIEDIASDPAAAGWAEAATLGGYRACFSVPLVSRNGDLLGAVTTFFRDPHRPTDRQLRMVEQYVGQAADSIDNARRHLAVRESERRKEEFLATLAHELRNPLAAIQNCGHLLSPDALDEAMLGEVRGMIVRQARLMARLVEDLLDATRISRGTIAVRKEPVNLAEIVGRAVEDVRPLIEARAHQLILSLPEEPLRLEADPTRLEQILANLLTNAAKYTDPGGRIELTAGREADDVVVRVRDTGIGLSADALSGLFNLFTQVDAARERSHGGLGIGLALVKSLVELHGGSVSAHSDGPGTGSEFVVRLPIQAAAPTAGPAEADPRDPAGSGRPTLDGGSRRES